MNIDFEAARHIVAAGPLLPGSGAVVATDVADLVLALGEFVGARPQPASRWHTFRNAVARGVARCLQAEAVDRLYGPAWAAPVLDAESACVLRHHLNGTPAPAGAIYQGPAILYAAAWGRAPLPRVEPPGVLVTIDARSDERLVRSAYLAGAITSMAGPAFEQECEPGSIVWSEGDLWPSDPEERF